jgi:diguanylate cyclase (GGDEF)-like protein
LFRELVEKALAVAARQHTLCALMLLDVDDFKRINDNYGHTAGDTVLREFANRLKQCLRDSDTIARQAKPKNQHTVNMSRLGGDEFTILLNGIETTDTATLVAQRIVNAMHTPFKIDDRETLITTSIGIACFPRDGQDVDTLIRHADIAMYAAKRYGKNMFQLYGPSAQDT